MRQRRAGAIGLAACLALLLASSAQAAVPATLHDSANCNQRDAADNDITTLELPYVFCDDGVPSLDPLPGPGGATANPDGRSAITVPLAYEGADTFTGLPAKDLTPPAGMLGATGGDIALDVDLSIPATAPPSGGYPMVVLMHGCCGGNKTSWEATTIDAGGERWHYSNAWFASRGYVVVTYTARGFVSAAPGLRGSTGETQLDSRSFEVNDYQALACNILNEAQASAFEDVDDIANISGPDVVINPDKVIATGGSYGGGFSWLALTDPVWTCTPETGGTPAMSLAAVAPKYGWTDLAYTLVPNGTHSQDPAPASLPQTNGCDSGGRDLDGADCTNPSPTGIPKTSIISGLYLSGTLTSGDHTTFPPEITDAFSCLQGTYPLESSPACDATLTTTLPRFLRERSAYYQNDFFTNITAPANPAYVTPIFNAGTLTDPLFPAYENRRMANRILSVKSDYPIQQYYGDYQHFVQNKAKEWGDLCGGDHHVCTLADFDNGLNANPTSMQGFNGATTRLNRFLDHYAAPASNTLEPLPDFNVTASLQVCPGNAGELGVPADEPGLRFTAASGEFADLAPNTLTVQMAGAQTTSSTVLGNSHAATADPVANSFSNGGRCPRETAVAGPGVASYTSDALTSDTTMIGSTVVTAGFGLTGPSDGAQLDARLYDVFPDGSALMVDRGPHRITGDELDPPNEASWELHGNGWRFQPGHRIRIELTQDDQPFVKQTSIASSMALTGVELAIPIRETPGTVGGGPDPKPSTGGGSGPGGGQQDSTKKCKKGFKLKKGKCKKKKRKKK